MKVEIKSKKFIKPSIPTPKNLSHHDLSFFDEFAPQMYAPIILYYSSPNNITNEHFFTSCMYQLQTSLSKTLVQFYPLAGRYNKQLLVVDCNDEGVEFIEANVGCHLHEFLSDRERSESQLLNSFIPCQILDADEASRPMLAIQITMFKCGGFALGVCISHRIADGTTLSMFLQAWSATANLNHNQQRDIQEISPSLTSAFYFPKKGLPQLNFEEVTSTRSKIVTRRFLFDNKAISALRTIVPSKSKPISRLQLVNAVIWKALVGVEKLKDEDLRATLVMQAINLREKINDPLLPKNCFGNLCIPAYVPLMAGENMEIQDLANQLSNSIKESLEVCSKKLFGGNNDPFDMNAMLNYYMISSWSRLPFYASDFGWGKPTWVSSINFPIKNAILMMDNKTGDGFEAWVNFDEKDMLIFEQDCDIKAFSS